MGQYVVVGIDGSDSSLQAVRWAADEARRRGVGLRLLHAVELPASYSPRIIEWNVLHSAMTDRGHEWLAKAQAEARAEATGVDVETVLTEADSAVPALVKESNDAALVVLGSRGLGGFSGLLIGSTAVGLAGRSRCPVIVVRGTPSAGPVLVGVDGTPAGEGAIAFAFAQASALGADLVAVHAWSDLVIDAALMTGAGAIDFGPLEQRSAELLAERLAGWPERYPDVHVTRDVVRDRPAKALLRRAAQARLVVVGSRGRGGFRGLLLGSTSQHLLYHAACPVAVVRTDPESASAAGTETAASPG
ncbi:MAG TPA: universal stress protein [Actinophytocola sp.]|jgi:nucleotide-binding universal stress UspA family protein|uniref:universal stress protein n=1 Tax=Actinophytocola sp. TaxID=1872138 RepID=UPI002F933157